MSWPTNPSGRTQGVHYPEEQRVVYGTGGARKLGERQWRQQKGKSAEMDFETFCNENEIFYARLEDERLTRKKVLKNPEGKCPDFLCTKNGNQIFVEVKSHTLLTNEVRNKAMKDVIQAKTDAGVSGTTILGPFDPLPELKSPFTGYLKDASGKFKNINKEKYGFPRILLLNVTPFRVSDVRAVFSGLYPSFRQNGSFAGFSKVHRGLLDSTGSNVSAIVYWDADIKKYGCLANSCAQIIFLEEKFRRFFEISHD